MQRKCTKLQDFERIIAKKNFGGYTLGATTTYVPSNVEDGLTFLPLHVRAVQFCQAALICRVYVITRSALRSTDLELMAGSFS
jgi:hypothetical protein